MGYFKSFIVELTDVEWKAKSQNNSPGFLLWPLPDHAHRVR